MSYVKSDGIPKAETVLPIKRKSDLKKVKVYLKATNLRNYTIFTVGINVLLRAGDLLNLKWSDVMENENQFKDRFTIAEDKTDKRRTVKMNSSALEALKEYKESLKEFHLDLFIFESRKKNKDGVKKLEVKALHRIVKETCKNLGLKGNYGTHTLRKTGAYHMYVNGIAQNPMILAKLQRMLNHSSSAVTLRYIGIEQQEIDDIYDELNL